MVRGLNSLTFKGARLDRGLYNVEWWEIFLEASLFHLPRAQFDHAPLMVRSKNSSHGQVNRPFRFQMDWLSHLDFKQFVEKSGQGMLFFNKR